MDKKMKNKYALTAFGLLLFILPLFTSNSVIYNKFQTNNGSNSKDPNISAKLPSIYIDDLLIYNTSYSGNWIWAESQDWCTGSGTPEDPYLIVDQTFDGGGSSFSLLIINSRKHFIVQYCTFFNSGAGAGLYLQNNTNGQILNNVIFDNNYGIYSSNVNDTDISSNEIYSNDVDGVYITISNYLTISDNKIYSNGGDGIKLGNSNYLSIINNEIYTNNLYGINITGNCNYLTISDNKIHDNISQDGIYLGDTNHTTISNNNIYDNGNDNGDMGIQFTGDSDNNTIVGNNIREHEGYGTYVDSNSDNNLFYDNIFKNNWRNAYDDGSNNDWNITGLGNYWDDYDGWDNNSDGIGDTPYTNIYGTPPSPSNDSYPIWDIRGPIVIDDFLTTNTDNTGNWTWAVSQPWCNGSGSSANPYLIQGMTIDAKGSTTSFTNCLLIANSTAHFIIRNCTFFGADDAGINLVNVENAQIIENDASLNTGFGIYLDSSNSTMISGNVAHNNNDYGIKLLWSNDNEIVDNIANDNGNGIGLDSSNYNTISGNNVSKNTNYGIELVLSNDNEIIENIANDNQNFDGIFLDACNDNTVTGSYANNNGDFGISLDTSDNNTVTGNYANNNGFDGISLDTSNNNTVTANNLNSNLFGDDGIYVSNSMENLLSENIISTSGTDDNGISLFNSDNITIRDNEIYNNWNGIRLVNSNNNSVYGNIIRDNSVDGVNLDLNSDNNSFYNNYFLRNGKHAVVGSIYNTWNSSAIGNYWDNYTGPDDDPPYGIGDIPHNISLSPLIQDFLPIIDDSPPSITVYSPETDDVYGPVAPSFSVSISDPALYNTWYTIEGGEKIFFTGSTGIINQTTWNTVPSGNVNITFWANDTIGQTNSVGAIVVKDLEKPVIYIHSPKPGYSYGTDAPDFGLTIIEDHLDTTWYNLNNGTPEYINTTSGTIKQTVWNALPQGDVNVSFYVNDTVGFLTSEDVIIIKDIEAPIINISSPEPNKAFGKDAPSFNVRITDKHLVKMWYTLNNGSDNYYFITNGTINQKAWDGLSQGSVLITFFANDKTGHITSESVTIKKKISRPIGLDFFTTTVLISIASGVAIISIITKILVKKRINY